MQKKITLRGVPHSDIIEEHVYEKLQKIEKFLQREPEPITIDLVLEPSKLRQHSRVELRVKSPHYNLVADYEHEGEEFYQVLDHVIDIMYHQLLKAKERRIDVRNHQSRFGDPAKRQR